MRACDTSISPPCPCRVTRWPSPNMTRSTGSSSREGTSTGRCAASSERSATRAERLAERTEPKVAAASTSVPPAVASEEMVTQSAKAARRSGLTGQGAGVYLRDVGVAAQREREVELCQQAAQHMLDPLLAADRQPPHVGAPDANAVSAQRERLEHVGARAHAAIEEHGQLGAHGRAHRRQGV